MLRQLRSYVYAHTTYLNEVNEVLCCASERVDKLICTMGISRKIHDLKITRVLACIGIVCICTVAITSFRYVFTSDVSVFLPSSGTFVEVRTEANVGLTVNLRVRKISERRFGGCDSNSSVRFYPPCSGGAADSALFISLQLQIGGIEPNPGPDYCVESAGKSARQPFIWVQLCTSAYPNDASQRYPEKNSEPPAIMRCVVSELRVFCLRLLLVSCS